VAASHRTVVLGAAIAASTAALAIALDTPIDTPSLPAADRTHQTTAQHHGPRILHVTLGPGFHWFTAANGQHYGILRAPRGVTVDPTNLPVGYTLNIVRGRQYYHGKLLKQVIVTGSEPIKGTRGTGNTR
jgi:hypothetical protein